MKKKVSAIICAAGKGERAGFDKHTLLIPLHGAPVLYHTLKKFDIPEIDEIIITSSEKDFAEISALASSFGAKTVLGGSTRTESVKRALEHVSGEIVLIHDGARPYLTHRLIRDCIDATVKYRSAVCAVKASDTAVYSDGEQNYVDRDKLFLLQTPQAFFTEDIKKAYSLAGGENFTDDSRVYSEFIGGVHLIDGETQNRKLTFKSDFLSPLPFAFTDGRIGFGVDTHAFGKGSFVTIGGVRIECENSLIAHSDGDVLIHSVMDALLSGAGLKDIGHYFPDTDEKFRNADSAKMLEEVVKIIGRKGFKVNNVSISIQAEKPRLKNHIDKIRQNLSKILNVDESDIAVSAGTCEGLGFVGEGLGITSYAIAALTNI